MSFRRSRSFSSSEFFRKVNFSRDLLIAKFFEAAGRVEIRGVYLLVCWLLARHLYENYFIAIATYRTHRLSILVKGSKLLTIESACDCYLHARSLTPEQLVEDAFTLDFIWIRLDRFAPLYALHQSFIFIKIEKDLLHFTSKYLLPWKLL